MKAKQINKIIGFSAVFACAYLVMSAIKRKREGIGRIERIKRRIYKEVSLAQDAGVDFSKKYAELSSAELDALKHIGQDVVGWKQSKRSIESGKPYTESYYASLRRAWNAVSGIEGIGRVYNVKDANGNICLTWIEDAAAHVEAERDIEEKRQRTLEAEERAAKARKSRQRTRRAIERGETPVTNLITHGKAILEDAIDLGEKRVDEPEEPKTKQQQILDKFPYLKIMDDPSNPIPAKDVPFDFVLWKIVKNNMGEKSYEGAAMAFTSRAAAESAKAYMKRDVKGIITDEWYAFYERMRDEYDKRTGRYASWHSYKDDAQYLVKDINKVNLDKISGIGYAPDIETELFEIWREQLDYGDTDYDFDTWKRIYGDEYIKSSILPYM